MNRPDIDVFVSPPDLPPEPPADRAARARPIPGIEFDPRTHTIPNSRGRVLTPTGTPIPGVYTAGWIKRGPVGVIGTNRTCAEETVACLLVDHRACLLT
ncbi:hypothetical protein AB0L82_39385 [Nocardia sp. NPDC052001]|uniref:hypothetical protein n=1 Tax=Nocardia sp. NPDC052001 TaxID=3154853 RepID=UPI0034423033